MYVLQYQDWVNLQVTLFVVHCAACFFYFLAENYPEPERTWIGQTLGNFKQRSLWVKYVTSIYWSITTFTTTGYGDIHPANTRERLFDIFYMFLNLGLLSYLLGNMNNLVIHGTSRTRKFVSKFILSSFTWCHIFGESLLWMSWKQE